MLTSLLKAVRIHRMPFQVNYPQITGRRGGTISDLDASLTIINPEMTTIMTKVRLIAVKTRIVQRIVKMAGRAVKQVTVSIYRISHR